MTRHVAIAVGIFVCIAVFAFGGRFAVDKFNESKRLSATDAGKVERIYRIGIDNWVGYAPLCGGEMARRLAASGMGLECINDNADYEARFSALRSGDLDLAVTTVDAYLRDFDKRGASGPIVSVIDESSGGDAIVAYRDIAPTLDALRSRTGDALTVAYTPSSPSEYLLLSIGQHFGIPFVDEGIFSRRETGGSPAALRALEGNKAQIAVLWEPDVSAALKDPNITKLIGSEDTEGLIVDVLVASPPMVADREEDLRTILSVFFDTLEFFESNTSRRDSDISVQLGVSEQDVESMVRGVRWAYLLENGVTWFDEGPDGYGQQKLTRVLHSTQAILNRAGMVESSQLAAGEVLSLIYSGVVEAMYADVFGTERVPATGNKQFPELSDAEWAQLKPIGALKVDDIKFQPGTALLTAEAHDVLDQVAGILDHYPNYRLVIRGHTSNLGDPVANRELSVKRASSVLDFLLFNHPIDASRVRAEGYGGEMPLERLPDESLRSWRYRLPRVEMAVLGERR